MTDDEPACRLTMSSLRCRLLVAALCWLCLLTWAGGALAARNDDVRWLTQAVMVATDGSGTTKPVQLPYDWDRHAHDEGQWVRFELSFTVTGNTDEPYGLYLPRIGNRARIILNDNLVGRYGDLMRPASDDFARAPRFLPISASLLRPDNRLVIDIAGDPGRHAGLSAMMVGPADAVRGGPFFWDYTWRIVVGSIMMGGFGLLIGLVSLGLLATQRVYDDGQPRRDRFYLYAAIGQLCWVAVGGNAVLQHPPLGWPAWGWLLALAYGGWLASTFLLCQHASGWRIGPPARWAYAIALAGPVAGALLAGIVFEGGSAWPLQAWRLLVTLGVLWYVAVFTRFAWRRRDTLCRLLAVACWVSLLVSIYDESRWLLPYGIDLPWSAYASLLFGAVLAYAVMMRFSHASRQAHELNQSLAQRVAQREAELHATYQRLEQMARSEARATERARILQDLHDGVGSHLSLAIHQLQSRADPTTEQGQGDVLHTLRDTQAYLKLSVDAMHLEPGDVAGLLANLRYRLQDRLTQGGIRLQWQVQDIPSLPSVDETMLVQLQYILFEALSNALQHAHAATISVSARRQGDVVAVGVTDDGRGFDPSVPGGRGLHLMRERAARIGATLAVDSRPGQTRIEVLLPFQ